jgi:hypothetical protein
MKFVPFTATDGSIRTRALADDSVIDLPDETIEIGISGLGKPANPVETGK